MSKKLKRSAVALVLAATMVFSSQGVLTAFAAGENETSTAVDVSALEPILDKEETDVANESGNVNDDPRENVCEICGGVDGQHEEGCSANQQPENTCPVCGGVDGQHTEDCTANQQPDEGDSGETTCPVCGGVDGQHTEDCTANQQPDEGDSGETTCPECGGVDGQHEENCSLAQESDNTPSEEDVAAVQAVVDLINALPTTDDLANYTPTIELKPEDEGYQEAYQAALDTYYSQIKKDVEAARAAYDALTEEQKAAFDATVLAKLTALEELIAMREQADVLPETEEINPDTVAIIETEKGFQQYKTLDEAVAAFDATQHKSIELCKDDTLSKLPDKDLSFTGKGNISLNKFTINPYTHTLSLQGNGISFTWTDGDGGWLMLSLSGTINVKDGATFTMSFDSNNGSKCAIYPSSSAAITVDNGSTFQILGHNTKGIEGQAIQLDPSAIGMPITITNNSTFLIDGTNRGYTGSPTILVENSTFTIKNCTNNASNGGDFTAINSTITYQDNAGHGLSADNVVIKNSIFTSDHNGHYGLKSEDKFFIDSTSTVTVTRNSYNGDFAGLKLRSGVTDGLVEAGATVNITGNYCSGLSNNGVCEFEEGVNLTITENNNDKGTTSNGGGVYNSGDAANLALPSNAVIYNNHALTDGDDIFNNTTATITFGKVGSDWKLDGAPDCNHAITGWFDDSEGNRWEAHDAPLHVSEFTNFNDAGIATISGLTALKAAHPYLTPEIEPGDPDVPSSDWPISKSKTAENLDENFESKVTLSLPADSYKPSVDVVMVMDVSSSMKGKDITEAKAAATAMCDELASKTNANVNIGIVTFDKEARNLTNGLVSIEEAKNAINNIKASEDTNMMAGLIAGKAMLDAGTATDKYLVIMSDGIPIYWVENGETISKTLIRYKQDKVTEIDRLPAGSEPEGSAPEDFDSMLSIKQLLNITDWDTDSNEWKQVSDTGENINPDCKYTNIQKATYKTAQYMIDNIFGQYKIKMVAFGTDKYENNVVYKYGENLCDWIGDQDGVSYYKVSKPNYGGEAGDLVEAFTDIANEMIYLVDAGSQVVDEIGFGTYEDGTEYDFDFVNEISKLELTVGGKALDKVQIDDYTYGFGPDSTLPKDYQFIVTYYPNGLTRSVAGELFVWDIYVPITIDDKVQLTYSVKLNDPRTDDGEYGIYDPDGSENRNGLYTNNAAVLYPVDNNGNNGEPEAFDKPTVSYTVSNGKPVEPTPDPDPDPDRPSRPNRDDDDDWEPLPDAPVKDKPTTEVDVPEETETPTTEQPDKYNPETGDTTTVFAAMALAAVSLGGVVLLGRKKK